MDFLGIGPAEVVMIVILLLLFLGPTDVVELFRKIGRLLRRLRESPTWNVVNSTAQTLRNLPNTLANEAGMDELRKDLQRSAESGRSIGKRLPENEPSDSDHPEEGDFSAWATPPPGPSVVPPPSSIRTRPETRSGDPSSETSVEADQVSDIEPEGPRDSE